MGDRGGKGRNVTHRTGCGTVVVVAAVALAMGPATGFGDWPVFRGDGGLRGVAAGSVRADLRLLWTRRLETATRAAPVIGGGTVFVGSAGGVLHALRMDNGEERWRFRSEAGQEIEAPAFWSDDTVYVGDLGGTLYALAAGNGREKWRYETGNRISGSANRVHGTNGVCIVFGSYDHRMHGVHASNGRGLWTYATGNFINGSPAVTGDILVFGGCDGRMHAVRGADGIGVGTVELGSYVAASPAVADGRAYIGHYGGRVVCVDLASWSVVWEYDPGKDAAPFFSSPAVSREHVLIGGRDQRLHCLRRGTGEPAWTFRARGAIDSSPVVSGSFVLFGSDDGRLYLVSEADGKEQWSYEVGAPIPNSPAVANGRVVVCDASGQVYCFGSEPADE